MPDKKIVRNALRCLTCDTVIESKHRHDFVQCNCPSDSTTNIFVDGGLDYVRYGYGVDALVEILTEYAYVENE